MLLFAGAAQGCPLLRNLPPVCGVGVAAGMALLAWRDLGTLESLRSLGKPAKKVKPILQLPHSVLLVAGFKNWRSLKQALGTSPWVLIPQKLLLSILPSTETAFSPWPCCQDTWLPALRSLPAPARHGEVGQFRHGSRPRGASVKKNTGIS